MATTPDTTPIFLIDLNSAEYQTCLDLKCPFIGVNECNGDPYCIVGETTRQLEPEVKEKLPNLKTERLKPFLLNRALADLTTNRERIPEGCPRNLDTIAAPHHVMGKSEQLNGFTTSYQTKL